MDTKHEQTEKIAKLLAKAHGAANQAEAEIFFAGAAKLMTKYGIEAHEVQNVQEKKEASTVSESAPTQKFWKSARPVHMYVRHVIRDCFDVMVVRSEQGHEIRYYFIGTKSDCEFAAYAFEVLIDTFNSLFTKYLVTTYGAATSKERNQERQNGFFSGLAHGFTNAWKEARAAEIASKKAHSFALVLQNKQAAIELFVKTKTNVVMAASKKKARSLHAFAAGVAAGQSIKIHKALN